MLDVRGFTTRRVWRRDYFFLMSGVGVRGFNALVASLRRRDHVPILGHRAPLLRKSLLSFTGHICERGPSGKVQARCESPRVLPSRRSFASRLFAVLSLHYAASSSEGRTSTPSSSHPSLVHHACSRPHSGHFTCERMIAMGPSLLTSFVKVASQSEIRRPRGW